MLSEGFRRREELKWLHTREIMTMIHNTSPYCKSKSAKELVPLSLDNEVIEDESASIALFQKLVQK